MFCYQNIGKYNLNHSIYDKSWGIKKDSVPYMIEVVLNNVLLPEHW